MFKRQQRSVPSNFSYYHSLINNVGHENERNEQQTQNV